MRWFKHFRNIMLVAQNKYSLFFLFIFYLLYFPTNTDAQQLFSFRHLDINDGLSQNNVFCMLQDREGFVWIGTEDGLNRYDGYEFKHYKRNHRKDGGISNNFINAIIEVGDRHLWVATADGLNVYDKKADVFECINTTSSTAEPYTRNFIHALFSDDDGNVWISTKEGLKRYDLQEKHLYDFAKHVGVVHGNRAHTILKDRSGKIWIGTTSGLSLFDSKNGQRLPLPEPIQQLASYYVRAIQQDSIGRIWFGSESNGLFVYDSTHETCIHYEKRGLGIKNSLPSNTVRGIFFKSNKEVWVGTLEGLGIIDLERGTVSRHVYDPNNQHGISYNSVRNFMQDNAGNIWLGTFAGGVNIYSPNRAQFHTIAGKKAGNRGLNHPVVSSILEAKNQGLWIGTEGGGLNYYDQHSDSFSYYSFGLSGGEDKFFKNIVKALTYKDSSHIWIGTSYGLHLFDIRNKTYRSYVVGDDKLFGSHQISALVHTEEGLWIGTNGGGLRFMDAEGKVSTFLHHPNQPHSIGTNHIRTMVQDKRGNLWIGTRNGLNYFDTKTKKIRTYKDTPNKGYSLNSNAILSVFIDSEENLWIGTDGAGLDMFDSLTGRFHSITGSERGNRVVRAIGEGSDGSIWISTNEGLSRIRPTRKGVFIPSDSLMISKYVMGDGLQSNQFSTGAVMKSRKGALFFGGIKGINWFFPEKIQRNKLMPNIVLTNVEIQGALPSENDRYPSIYDDAITLPHDHGSISFKFAALNFVAPEKNEYAYRLEGGGNKEWNYLGANQRTATFINLAPGKYRFSMRATNNDGIWSDYVPTVEVIVLPPFWRTWWAYCIYIALGFGLIYLFYYYSLKTAKLKNELHYKHLSNEKDRALVEQKINFFTNISHEIKTPLTLILAPLDKMLKSSREGSKLKPQLVMMQRNGERLNRLINQLLDFRKFESGHMLLKNTENDLVKFIEEICVVFESYAAQHNIQLKLYAEYTDLPLWFDEDKLEKIMYNLLSNAVKFSKDGGEIQVKIKPDETNNDFINIDIEDNGIGISEENMDTIFDQFQHSNETNINSTGIGLAFSKGLAELLGGDLTVKSNRERSNQSGYTCFTIKLPLIRKYLYQQDIETRKEEELIENIGVIADPEQSRVIRYNLDENITMLIVEDNIDLLEFMMTSFSERFTVHTAVNGKEGLCRLKEIVPDIIISDVMMPVMNGIEFCKKVKSDVRISHIPFILLTARTPVIYKIEGFEIGADDYITKPFRMDMLEARINNLISSRNKIIAQYKTELSTQPQNVDLTSPDEIFIAKLMDFIENNLSEPALNVEKMAKEVGLGRNALYRKIKTLTGKTAIEFIRSIRMKRAAQLLRQKKMNVNEVVYSVGFTDVDYFRRCFKEEFGRTPREYINSEEI